MPNSTAKNITQPVKSAQEPPAVALKRAPVTAVNPKGAQVEIAQAATPKPSGTPAAKPAPAQTAAASKPSSSAQLPKTASQLPLIFLLGMVSLGLSVGLRLLAKRVG